METVASDRNLFFYDEKSNFKSIKNSRLFNNSKTKL